jgi:hypothetical protein
MNAKSIRTPPLNMTPTWGGSDFDQHVIDVFWVLHMWVALAPDSRQWNGPSRKLSPTEAIMKKRPSSAVVMKRPSSAVVMKWAS